MISRVVPRSHALNARPGGCCSPITSARSRCCGRLCRRPRCRGTPEPPGCETFVAIGVDTGPLLLRVASVGEGARRTAEWQDPLCRTRPRLGFVKRGFRQPRALPAAACSRPRAADDALQPGQDLDPPTVKPAPAAEPVMLDRAGRGRNACQPRDQPARFKRESLDLVDSGGPPTTCSKLPDLQRHRCACSASTGVPDRA